MSLLKQGASIIGGLVILGIGINIVTSIKETISPSCSSTISKCVDNADVVNNYGRMSKAKNACMNMASSLANFGTPQWPSYGAFGSFATGDDFPTKNAVVLFDDDVMFSNGFGALVKTPLECDYDFASGTALVYSR